MKDFITLAHWRTGHPLPTESDTDIYYVNLTRRLYNTIRSTEMGRQSTDAWVAETAMMMAWYLEDVVSELGFWHVFVEQHRARYGKPLPFYTDADTEYYPDEVNRADICFLLWMAIQTNKRGALVNPENPYLTETAAALYRLLDKEFEKAPINEALLKAMKSRDNTGDPSSLFLLGMRITGTVYLFLPFLSQTARQAAAEVDSLRPQGSQPSMRDYAIRFVQTFRHANGPLALNGATWMAALLRFWGQDDEARRMEGMEVVPPAYYRLESHDEEHVCLEAADGQTFTLPADTFRPLVGQLMRVNKVCMATLVRYDDRWTTAGAVSWYADEALFERYRAFTDERRRVNADAFRRVTEGNDGRPMAYFADWSAFITWAGEHLEIEKGFRPTREMESGKCLVLFAHPDEGMTLVPNEARFICDPEHNPCYNAAQARRGSLTLLVTPGNLSPHMLRHLLDNHMLPDAALPSAKDEEHGRRLVQDHMDFLARFLRTADF